MKKSEGKRSWRGVYKVHPAADFFQCCGMSKYRTQNLGWVEIPRHRCFTLPTLCFQMVAAVATPALTVTVCVPPRIAGRNSRSDTA